MADLTTAEIRRLTALAPSTLGRHLARFPEARSTRGHYDVSEPRFRAWLELHTLPAGDPEPDEASDPLVPVHDIPEILPSGVILPATAWRTLRRNPEGDALRELDVLIHAWQLPRHPAVPDVLRYQELRLGSGLVVNGLQWRAFRRGGDAKGGAHLDVLIRTWAPHRRPCRLCRMFPLRRNK